MRLLPALVLMVLSPFVGEFLLGNLPPDPSSWVTAFLPLVLLYGGGALLIREVTRRLGRGYPTMVLLAMAYALVEEGVVLGTLFNREYLGLGLLEYGWLPEIGTSPVWSAYVIGIHTVWSIVVPIVLTEQLFPTLADDPWLRLPGTVVVAFVYLLGAAVVAAANYWTYRFFPTPAQVLVVLTLVVTCVVAALVGGRSRPRGDGPVASPTTIAAVALLGGSAFILAQDAVPGRSMASVVVTMAVMAVAAGAAGVTIGVTSRRRSWSTRHTLGAASGALATYAWAGFLIQFSVHGFTVLGLVAQIGFVMIAGAVLALCWRTAPAVDGPTPTPRPVPRSTVGVQDVAGSRPTGRGGRR